MLILNAPPMLEPASLVSFDWNRVPDCVDAVKMPNGSLLMRDGSKRSGAGLRPAPVRRSSPRPSYRPSRIAPPGWR